MLDEWLDYALGKSRMLHALVSFELGSAYEMLRGLLKPAGSSISRG